MTDPQKQLLIDYSGARSMLYIARDLKITPAGVYQRVQRLIETMDATPTHKLVET